MKFSPPEKTFAQARPSVAYIIDPRFPGGTSSAVAQELRAVAEIVTPRIFAISSKMFAGNDPVPALDDVLQALGLTLEWDPLKVSADVVILHNPAFLKFQSEFPARILARRLYVVTHENFIRPGGAESFDVATCLDQIDRAAVAIEKIIAPISSQNRATVQDWCAAPDRKLGWDIHPQNWFNICEFAMQKPTAKPQDRRGRLSRPGFEKFPGVTDMDHCFPRTAVKNILLGAEGYAQLAVQRPHWDVIPFQAMEVDEFFESIDFMVYFTAATWRESFGRVLAEGIAAGKVVISDAGTASSFGQAVVGSRAADVDEVIAGFIRRPGAYKKQVLVAQKYLTKFSADAFCDFFRNQVLAFGGPSA